VGQLTVHLGMSLDTTVQIVRLLVAATFLASVFWFVGLFADNRVQRWVGFLTIVLGGGFAWLFVVLKHFTGQLAFPMDLYIYESNTFLTVMAFPHQAMADALLVLVLGLSALAFERNSLRLATMGGLLSLGL